MSFIRYMPCNIFSHSMGSLFSFLMASFKMQTFNIFDVVLYFVIVACTSDALSRKHFLAQGHEFTPIFPSKSLIVLLFI